MKYVYLLGAIVAVGALAGFFYMQTVQTEVPQEVVVFTDAENNQFTMQYDTSFDTARLSLNGTQYELARTVSASGAKYENEDGSVVFWEKGGEARVEIGGEIVFEDAMTAQRRVEVSKSNKEGDPDANRYDFDDEVCDTVDQDCTAGDDSQRTACGAGTVLEGDVCVPEARDDDDDGDSLPTEAKASPVNGVGSMTIESDIKAVEAQDHNASRSNTTSD